MLQPGKYYAIVAPGYYPTNAGVNGVFGTSTSTVVTGGTIIANMGYTYYAGNDPNNGSKDHALMIVKATSNRVGFGWRTIDAAGNSRTQPAPFYRFTVCQLN